MTPSEYAAEKLELWKRALHEQRAAESALAAARKKRNRSLIFQLTSEVEFLQTKADLLLADAVKTKALLGDQPFFPSHWLITETDDPTDEDSN